MRSEGYHNSTAFQTVVPPTGFSRDFYYLHDFVIIRTLQGRWMREVAVRSCVQTVSNFSRSVSPVGADVRREVNASFMHSLV